LRKTQNTEKKLIAGDRGNVRGECGFPTVKQCTISQVINISNRPRDSD
jgi:hypothetical protein